MNEYTDVKRRKHKVIQTVRKPNSFRESKGSREAAEQEIVEALFRIFQPQNDH